MIVQLCEYTKNLRRMAFMVDELQLHFFFFFKTEQERKMTHMQVGFSRCLLGVCMLLLILFFLSLYLLPQ